MKSLVLMVICASAVFALPSTFAEAEACTPANCQLKDGCVCSSQSALVNNAPQLVTLTFDDSVTSYIHDTYYEKLLFSRKNSDGKPITATFYVPHQYTDYEKVNSLYNRGHDIGVNSITKITGADYWKLASVQQLKDEFQGQREIIAKFANIPINEIKGVRTPHLQLAGDKSFQAYAESSLEYDSSWITLSNKPLFPYTLDFKSTQECHIGECPKQSWKKLWVAPIVNFIGTDNEQCNVLFSCTINGTVTEIRNWLNSQFERSYSGNRQPITILVNSAWFELVQNSFDAFSLFLDDMLKKPDTFLVSHKEVIAWAKNPVTAGSYKTSVTTKNQPCTPITCPLKYGEFETRYMKSCVSCPSVYPWLENPQGEVQ